MKIRENTRQALILFDDWSDVDLEKQFERPYYGAQTYEDALHYALIGHFDEHLGQVRRAIGNERRTG